MGALHLAVGSRWEVAGHCEADLLEVEHLTVSSQIDTTISLTQTHLNLHSVELKIPSDYFDN